MKQEYLNDIYKDFFGNIVVERQEKQDENLDYQENIDSLLVSSESKTLLEKIYNYISMYKNKEVSNHLNFNLLINSDNKETLSKIEEIYISILKYYSYLDNYNIVKISFYEVNDSKNINDLISKNGIIILKDLKGLELKDINFKKSVLHFIESNISNKVFIVEDKKINLDVFFELSSNLRDNYFPFVIDGINPNVQDVYNDLLDLISKEVSEDDKIKLLDYIINTFEKSDLDYPTYRDNLLREIAFNGCVPKLEISKSIEEVFSELDELVGLEKVKKTLRELVDLISLKEKARDLKLSNINLHMVFLGNPGTGKTTVARMISDILYNLKYIKQNKLIEVSAKDLIAEYAGQTAPKTMNLIEKALGGVLFIDEAYTLSVKDRNAIYNAEAIATLIKAMEDYRDELVVIFAGYTKEMNEFLNSNSGIVSRIGYTFEFDDYTEDELVDIFNLFAKKAGFKVSDSATVKLRETIKEYQNVENFGNARFVRTVFEKTVIKHATNCKDKKRKDILYTISGDDISVENIKK